MNRRQITLSASTLFVALLPAIGIFLGDTWWSINHLRFLPIEFVGGYALALVFICMVLTQRFEGQSTHVIDRADTFLFSSFGHRQFAFAGIFTALFVIFQCQTYFLGDGYTLTGLFSLGTDSIQKPTEFGSTVVIWIVQSLLGEASQETAEIAIRVISIACGVVSLALFRLIALRIGNTPASRMLCFGTLVGGGWMLLFFGYIEYYPLLWVAALAFIWSSLRFLQIGRGFVWVLLFFVASCLMHLQAAYFVGGLLYLTGVRMKFSPAIINRYFWPVMLTGIAAVLATVAWLYQRDVSYELTFLPLFTGRPLSPEYAILSPFHFGDIAQLILLLVPAILPLVLFRIVSGNRERRDTTQQFLLTLTIGSGLFLLVIDPVLGLGRDWDLFSLTLLAPALLFLHDIRNSSFEGEKRYVIGTILSGIVLTTLFIAVSVRITSSEHRFYELLKSYGTKERIGWAILGKYFDKIGERQMALSVTDEMNHRFPEYVDLKKGYKLLESGKIAAAERIANTLVAHNPYEANFLVLQANVADDKGKYDTSLVLYKRALSIGPYLVPIWNELGQLYLEMRQYDSAAAVFHKGRQIGRRNTNILEGLALAYYYQNYLDSALMVADSLRAGDPDSPGASLVQLIVALRVGDSSTARGCLMAFRATGAGRSDYRKILAHFGNLSDTAIGQK